MSIVLKTEGLSHRYTRASWAIRDINLSIPDRGIVGLLGSNGAGKSTTMNIICGVLNQSEGNVFISGIDLRKHPEEAKKQIGFLPQTPPLYGDFTVDEYLTYSAELRFIPDAQVKKAVEEVKEKCGIAHVNNRLIKNLSGGYRQRVGIAQAVIHKPKLVVLDEPTNGLDPNQLIEVRKLIREISTDHAVMLSSHILSEIHLLCEEIVMIEKGRMVFSDTMEAFNNYVQPSSILMRVESRPAEHQLTAIQGVNRVDFMSDKQIRIYFDGGQDIVERLVAASLQHNWQMREINFEKGVLDDTFKQLSNQNHQ